MHLRTTPPSACEGGMHARSSKVCAYNGTGIPENGKI